MDNMNITTPSDKQGDNLNTSAQVKVSVKSANFTPHKAKLK